eukprot:TRINITY_DN62310_c0_g1_i1.p1 TRINITY_DN62310_c0_g1~~TRINITY_DN62310_c0_g1_i1.p1  ORF type:complete len:552 (+),score=140.09 TRINITY_DN62310_c0_g1_i1:74-1729(+)
MWERSRGRELYAAIVSSVVLSAFGDVSCGNHRAANCAGCPQGHGAAWCNNDCEWKNEKCVPRGSGSDAKSKGADYYAALGIARDADEAAIKKAYRQKSLEYHPDKCTLDKEECQAKFIEVSTANEVLSDKQKRKTYDKYGEEGLKDGGAGQGNAEAMFRQFFGREPNGKVRIVKGPFGQTMFQELGEEGPEENIYDGSNVTELQHEAWNNAINQRDEPWIVKFYKPNNDESVQVKEEYKKFANTFGDFLNVAAVNCRKQRQTCGDASITDYPAVRWFSENKDDAPEIFEGTLDAKQLGKFANSMLKDLTTLLVDKRRMREWVDSESLPIVVLFTDKRETPAMWKAISSEFRGRVALGTIAQCDKAGVFKTELQRLFDVRIPAIVHIDRLGQVGSIAEKFDSQFKKKVISLWLQKIIAVSKKAGPAASFKEWSKQRMQEGDCGPGDGQFCFLWLKAGADAKVEEAMRSLAQKYRTDPIKMMWISSELNPWVLDAFGLQDSDASDFFIAYRSKRGKFKLHEGELEFQQLDGFVDGVLNGGPLTSKVHADKLEL